MQIASIGDEMSVHEEERPPPYLHDLRSSTLPSVLSQNAPVGVPLTPSALIEAPSTRFLYGPPFITNNIKVEPTTKAHFQDQRPARGTALRPDDFPQVPITAPGGFSRLENTMDIDEPPRRRDTSVSMDDPDDRMAVEALCGLGKVGA